MLLSEHLFIDDPCTLPRHIAIRVLRLVGITEDIELIDKGMVTTSLYKVKGQKKLVQQKSLLLVE